MDLNQPIYYIENRNWLFIYHFLILMIGGLRHIKESNPVIYVPYIKEHMFDVDKKLLVKLSQQGNDYSPIMLDKKGTFSYSVGGVHYEIMNLLKDKYTFIDSIAAFPYKENLQFIYHHGEPITLDTRGTNVHPDAIVFLRNLFSSLIEHRKPTKGKYIYITRKNSENISGHNGSRIRYVINEDELVTMLNKFNFQYVQLENYSFLEKIELFQTAEIILSPNSGGLTFSFMANTSSLIIELMPFFLPGQYKQHWKQEQFKEMCEAVGVPYFCFREMTYVEDNLNMCVNVSKLEEYLSSCIKQNFS
jgi:hypothetical protein